MCFDAPMPPESAKEMIALHEAGVLNSIAIGYDVRREESEAAIGWGDKQYDMAINCTGTRLNFETTKESLYRTICDQHEVRDGRISLSEGEYLKMCTRIEGNPSFTGLEKRFKPEGDRFVHRTGESGMKAFEVDTSGNPDAPRIILSRDLVAVSTAADGAKTAMRNTIAEILTPIPSVESSSVIAFGKEKQHTIQQSNWCLVFKDAVN